MIPSIRGKSWRNCWPARNGHRIRKEVFDEMVERK
nr:MAG TPA: hypothetical protein [Caudoviricetes sp.]